MELRERVDDAEVVARVKLEIVARQRRRRLARIQRIHRAQQDDEVNYTLIFCRRFSFSTRPLS